MPIVENNRIRVDVDPSYYNKLLSTTKPRTWTLKSGDVKHESSESIVRGLILSEAMSVIGNTHEVENLKELEFTPEEIKEESFRYLFCKLAEEHSNNPSELLRRYFGGRAFPKRMEKEVDTISKLARYRCTDLENLKKAKERLQSFVDLEIRYRSWKSACSYLNITVKSGLPNQIGLCRIRKEV